MANDSRKVKQFTIEGIFIKTFDSISDATKETKVNLGSITNCCRKKVKSAGGYVWEYDLSDVISPSEEAKKQALKDIEKDKEQQQKEEIITPYRTTANPYYISSNKGWVNEERRKLKDGILVISHLVKY